MTLRSLNKGPEGVSHFLSRITLAHRFCKLITSWTCGFGLLLVPKTIPCSMKILRVLIFANYWPRSAKISQRRKKKTQNKTPQKLTPFSQIKNSAFNGLVVYGWDRLLFCFAVVQSLCAVRYYSAYRIILHNQIKRTPQDPLMNLLFKSWIRC